MSARHALALAALAGFTALAGGCSWLIGVSGQVDLVADEDAAADQTSAADGPSADHVDSPASDGAADRAPDAVEDAEIGNVPEGGLAPSPGRVQCGTTTCPLSNRECCYTSPSNRACTDRNNPNCPGGVLAQCDETSDCDGGVCCVISVRSFGVETLCQAACGAAEARACRTNAECSGSGCVPFRCAGSVVETCGGEGSDAGCLP